MNQRSLRFMIARVGHLGLLSDREKGNGSPFTQQPFSSDFKGLLLGVMRRALGGDLAPEPRLGCRAVSDGSDASSFYRAYH